MNVNEIYKSFRVSFEIFPPKTQEGEESLFQELSLLKAYNPAFISVTYGAGGSTREKTFDLAVQIRERFGINPLIHFTCVGFGAEQIRRHIEQAKAMGLTDILALRGDPPRGSSDFVAPADGFAHANELVRFIRKMGGFNIAVAGYPEKHPAAKSFEEDVDYLKMKIDEGANLVLTQFFFNNDSFYRLTDALHKRGCDVAVIPGMLPITSVSQIERFADLSGAALPADFKKKLLSCGDPDDAAKIGIEHCIMQCRNLKERGIKGLHMYSLNKAWAAGQVLDGIF